MNYKKHYDLLIQKAINRPSPDFKERHHIVPKCLGGDNSRSNLADLTPEEHYVAHQLLAKIYPDHSGLCWAAIRQAKNSRNRKAYGWLRRRHAAFQKCRVVSEATKEKLRNRPITKEWCERIAKSKIGNKNCVGRNVSAETRAKIGAGNKGKVMPADAVARMAAAHRGMKRPPFTAEHIENMRKAQLNRIKAKRENWIA